VPPWRWRLAHPDLVARHAHGANKVALPCGFTPLQLAAAHGHVGLCQALVERWKLNPNDGGHTGEPPACLAAQLHGGVEAVRALVLLGADPNARCTPSGFTALMCACRSGRADVAEALVALGANVRATAEGGETAAHIAAQWCGSEIMMKLLGAGADAAAVDGKGWQPIHHAADAGRLVTVKALAKAGVDWGARTPDGESPMTLAAARGHDKVVAGLVLAAAAGGEWRVG